MQNENQPDLIPAPSGNEKKLKSYRLPIYTVTLVRDGCVKSVREACDTASKAAALFWPLIGGKDREHFAVLMVDARSKPIGLSVVSIGTVSASLVHPRELFKPAILAGAAAIVVAHNHPSGEVTPSPEDKDATRRIVRAGELLGVPCLDHVILGVEQGEKFSFKEAGII